MRATLIALAALPIFVGCAATHNIFDQEECRIYGGTRLDAEIVSQNLGADPKEAKAQKLERPVLVYAALCGLADMPLSMVVDTVTLPITVPVVLGSSKTRDDTSTQSKDDDSNGDRHESSADNARSASR